MNKFKYRKEMGNEKEGIRELENVSVIYYFITNHPQT